MCEIMAEELSRTKILKLLLNRHTTLGRLEKSAILLRNGDSVRGFCRMYRLGMSARWAALAMACAAVLAGVYVWIGSSTPRVARDYEDCTEEAQANATSSVEYSKLITHCGERYAGRRKAGGGYAYFDFMQNRTFDIAGPNPTDDERKQIDHTYMEFLGAQ